IHPLQIDGDAAAHIGRRTAIREVLTGRDRVERDLVLVRRANDRLHLLGAVRSDGRGWDQLVRLILDVREMVPVRVKVLIAREDPLGSDRLTKLAQRGLEALRADPGRQYRHNPLPLPSKNRCQTPFFGKLVSDTYFRKI